MIQKMRLVAERGVERFEIIEGTSEGFYVLRFSDGQNTHDYLQDTIALAKLCAKEEWNVELAAWREAPIE
jgi:hypothetical protein